MAVVLYRKNNNKYPIDEFIKTLKKRNEKVLIEKAYDYITLLDEYGYKLPEPYCKYIGDKLYELRPSNVRIFYIVDGDTYILLHGFIKKSNKIPSKELETAKKYQKDYWERRNNEKKEY